jgi:putative copper export protein
MYGLIVFLHVLGASVWVGGHLVLTLSVLPRALKSRQPEILLAFERGFERVGMPALLLQVVTGLWLAHRSLPVLADWFTLGARIPAHILAKLALLVATLAVAASARWRVIPRLSPDTLPTLAWHVALVTLFAVLLVAVGVSLRTGLLF